MLFRSNDTATTEIYTRRHTLSLHDALPIFVADKLAAAMRTNPAMRVHVACGFHDGATPYYAAEHTFAHLEIPAELHDNIEFAYHEAGHMMYVHEPSRLAQSQQLASFVSAD